MDCETWLSQMSPVVLGSPSPAEARAKPNQSILKAQKRFDIRRTLINSYYITIWVVVFACAGSWKDLGLVIGSEEEEDTRPQHVHVVCV